MQVAGTPVKAAVLQTVAVAASAHFPGPEIHLASFHLAPLWLGQGWGCGTDYLKLHSADWRAAVPWSVARSRRAEPLLSVTIVPALTPVSARSQARLRQDGIKI